MKGAIKVLISDTLLQNNDKRKGVRYMNVGFKINISEKELVKPKW